MNSPAQGTQAGFDQTTTHRPGHPRLLQTSLAVLALTCFASVWLLRDESSAVAGESATPVAVTTSSATTRPSNPIGRDSPVTTTTPVVAVSVSGVPLQTTSPASNAALEASAIARPAAIGDGEAQVIDEIGAELAQKPSRSKLSLPAGLRLHSSVVLVVDQNSNEVLAEKNADTVRPIASLTKLMTALVVTDAHQPLDEVLSITGDDIDREKHTYSRLTPGLQFTRRELLLLALMSSENRAASALGRNYPGGRAAFIKAMNSKAHTLGMTNTHYDDSNGLSTTNVSTARDLVKLVEAAHKVPLIREYSTEVETTVKPGRRVMHFVSSNRLVRGKNDWRIGLQKTGFTNEAGRCLVMQATVKSRPLVMVLLDSDGKLTRFADAQRVRSWLESNRVQTAKAQDRRDARRASSRNSG